jgi:phytanoyl-CoA hydroxylase
MITQGQIDFFHANGYLIMPGVIQGRELKMLQDAAEEVKDQGVARQGDLANHRYAPGPDGREVYWRSENMWERADIFQAVTVHPDLLENIGQCVGQAFYPWNDSLVVKLPNSGAEVKWHQDPPYRNPDRETVYPVPNFTTDIYLDHSGPDNGCVYAIPGHHLVGHVDLGDRSHRQFIEECGAVPLELEAGDVLFHCLSTPHGSGPNLSNTQRRIFYIHYLADEVYRDGYGNEAWAAEKPGWGKYRRERVEGMLEKRQTLGLEGPADRRTLTFGSGGFEFVGAPTTPPRHWATLTAAIPPERRTALKQLKS